MPSRTDNGFGVQVEDTKICVVMVGLPARGKSYIAQIGKLQTPLQTRPWTLTGLSGGISVKAQVSISAIVSS